MRASGGDTRDARVTRDAANRLRGICGPPQILRRWPAGAAATTGDPLASRWLCPG
jgi:hypothetical protein